MMLDCSFMSIHGVAFYPSGDVDEMETLRFCLLETER